MTDNTWPDPAIAGNDPVTPKKSHKVRNVCLVVGALWLVGAAVEAGSNSSGTSTSDTNQTVSTSSSSSGSGSTSGQVPGKCSIWHQGYEDCIDTQVHDQMNNYYDQAQSCDIESSRYLQCLNDAYYNSEKTH